MAFKKPSCPTQIPIVNASSSHLDIPLSTLFPYLSSCKRESIHLALSGDFQQAISLLNQWDRDARFLEARGVSGIQRLSTEDYIKAYLLANLMEQPKEERAKINAQIRISHIEDDRGHLVHLYSPQLRLLPQTYVAASFLLAIAHPNEIAAIPKGLRHLSHIYSPALLEKIPKNVEDYSSEGLHLDHPDMAFVALYSHPSRMEMLRQQGIELCTIQRIDDLECIQNNLLKIGHISRHPLEASLLNLFIKACFFMVDNRLRALDQLLHQDLPTQQLLFLHCRQHLMLPTERCLTGQLLQRMAAHHKHLSCFVHPHKSEWQVACSQETIRELNPHCLVLSFPYSKQEIEPIFSTFLDFLPHASQNVWIYVDDHIQESPTQYLALAYYDLFQALSTLYLT